MNECSLLFFDIDGTLLDASGRVPASAQRAIQLAREHGHLCFVNTGRPYSHIVPAIRNIHFDGYICSCGQSILLNNQFVVHARFTPEEAKEIVALVRACSMDAVYEAEHGVWFDHQHSHNPALQASVAHFSALGFDTMGSVDDVYFYFDKFCVWTHPDSNTALFLEKIRPLCTVIERENHLLELVRSGYSKETGIQTVIEHTSIPVTRSYALGDSTNDLPMLRCVAHSIAMGNAPAEVKQVAEYVTATAEEDGVYSALTHFHLI